MNTDINKAMNKDSLMYVPFCKVDPEQRTVWGYASTGKRDSQGEIVEPEALKKAMPDYMKFANVREMHENWAVGVTKSVEHNELGAYISVKVVDRDAWDKVKEGVYKGFSIGGKVTARDDLDPTVIKGIDLMEISLVDRPANPEALFDVIKMADEHPGEVKPDDTVNPLEEHTEKEPVPNREVPDRNSDREPSSKEEVDLRHDITDPADPRHESHDPGLSDLDGPAPDSKDDPTKQEDPQPGVQGGDAPNVETLKFSLVGDIFKHFGLRADVLAETEENPIRNAMLMTLDLVAKSGARHSKGDKASLQAIHDHAAKMGAACDAEKASVLGDLAKVFKPGDLAKVTARAEKAEDALSKANETIASLNKKVSELEKLPVPQKGKLRLITKGEDVAVVDEEVPTIESLAKNDKLSSEEKAQMAIKMVHAGGGSPLMKR